MVLITEEISLKADILSQVIHSNLCSIIRSKVKSIDLIVDDAIGSALVAGGDDGGEGSSEDIADGSIATTTVNGVDISVG